MPSPIVAYMTLETGLPVVIVQDLHHRLKKRLDFDFFTDPSFSPDGARLALTSYLNFGSDIVTYDLTQRAQLQRLTAFGRHRRISRLVARWQLDRLRQQSGRRQQYLYHPARWIGRSAARHDKSSRRPPTSLVAR